MSRASGKCLSGMDDDGREDEEDDEKPIEKKFECEDDDVSRLIGSPCDEGAGGCWIVFGLFCCCW